MADIAFTRGLTLWGQLDDTNYTFMLLDTSYVPDKDHAFADEITADELTDASYNRQTLAGSSITYDDTLDRVKYSCADPIWEALAGGEAIGHVVLFHDTGDDSTSELMAAYEVSGTSNGQDMIFVVPDEGLMYTDQAA